MAGGHVPGATEAVVARYDGTSWTLSTTGALLTIDALSCSSPTFCLAEGVLPGGSGFGVSAFDGTSWSSAIAPADLHTLRAIDCVSATRCVVTGARTVGDVPSVGTSVTFDGSTFGAPVDAPQTTQLAALSCLGTAFCVAAGITGADDDGTVSRYDGEAWTTVPLGPTQGDFIAISCASPTFCAALDTHGKVVTGSGTTWSAPIDIGDGTWSDVSCGSPSHCVAVGSLASSTDGDPTGVVSVLDGTTWSAPTPVAGTHYLQSVSCPAADYCMAIAFVLLNDPEGVFTIFDGAGWSTPAPFGVPWLSDVSCAARGRCTALGDYAGGPFGWGDPQPVTFTFADGTWSGGEAAPGAQSLSCPTVDFCAGVGSDPSGVLATVRAGGKPWSAAVPIPVVASAGPIDCSTARFCVATAQRYDDAGVLTGSVLLSLDGSQWRPILEQQESNFSAISCAARDACTVVATDGTVRQSDD
jgi:hypothetical protein